MSLLGKADGFTAGPDNFIPAGAEVPVDPELPEWLIPTPPIPSAGGGYQLGANSLDEIQFINTPVPKLATVTTTLTVEQITGGVIVADPLTTAATYTLPDASTLNSSVTGAKDGSSFDLIIINIGTGDGIITVATGTGWVTVGITTIAVSSSAQFRARKTSMNTWTLYRTN